MTAALLNHPEAESDFHNSIYFRDVHFSVDDQSPDRTRMQVPDYAQLNEVKFALGEVVHARTLGGTAITAREEELTKLNKEVEKKLARVNDGRSYEFDLETPTATFLYNALSNWVDHQKAQAERYPKRHDQDWLHDRSVLPPEHAQDIHYVYPESQDNSDIRKNA